MKKFISAISLAISLIVANTAATAAESTVNFPAGQKAGTFSCTFDGSGKVRIDTHNVDAKGFCPGDPGVTRAGHLEGQSDDLGKYYFEIQKELQQSGSVTVSSVDTSVTRINCSAGHSGKPVYPYGDKYCAFLRR
ncbi:MAG: hypothetical protein K0S08_180 [Gammaproteobacteria bacterium]|nr:hypothetical protein [Gammaproteobacteria bacterium]